MIREHGWLDIDIHFLFTFTIESPNLSKITNVHTVAGILKMWLRDLPECVFSFDLYEAFIVASSKY